MGLVRGKAPEKAAAAAESCGVACVLDPVQGPRAGHAWRICASLRRGGCSPPTRSSARRRVRQSAAVTQGGGRFAQIAMLAHDYRSQGNVYELHMGWRGEGRGRNPYENNEWSTRTQHRLNTPTLPAIASLREDGWVGWMDGWMDG